MCCPIGHVDATIYVSSLSTSCALTIAVIHINSSLVQSQLQGIAPAAVREEWVLVSALDLAFLLDGRSLPLLADLLHHRSALLCRTSRDIPRSLLKRASNTDMCQQSFLVDSAPAFLLNSVNILCCISMGHAVAGIV